VNRTEEAATFSRHIALIVACSFFMEALDGSIVTTALPAIAHSFGRPTLSLTAGVSAYLVALAAFVPTAGWGGDRFGARNLFATAVAVFTLASLLCGLSQSPTMFIAARVLQGTAAAFMSPVGRLVVLRETPKRYIIEAIGLITWPGLIAPVIGPPLAGFLTTYASWRWIFLLNIPLGIVGVALIVRMVPRYAADTPKPFDVWGFILTATALALLVHGLTIVGDSGWAVGGAFIGAGLISGLGALRHARRHPTPMLDLRSASVPSFAVSILSAGMLARIAINATPFLLPLMFQIGFGLAPFQAGMMLLVYMLGNLGMKSITTATLRRFGFRPVLLVNGALCALSIAACGLLTPDMARPTMYAILLIAGMTRSMNFTSTNTLAFADIAPAERAGASTLAAVCNQLGSTLGVAVAALMLAVSQQWRGVRAPALVDFHGALWVSGLIMAAGTLWTLRLPPDAGAEVSRRG
jgi:EmrB/QacA subfamily drug resistance transporter